MLNPWRIPTSPEEFTAEKARATERDLAALRRNGQVPGIQSLTAVQSGTLSGLSTLVGAPTVPVSVTVNVPNTARNIVAYFLLYAWFNSGTGTIQVKLSDSQDFTSGWPNAAPLGSSTATIQIGGLIAPTVQSTAGGTVSAVPVPYVFYPFGLTQPTPGNHTISLQVYRSAGTGLFSITSACLWVAVL